MATLNIETANLAGGPLAYAERVEEDRKEIANNSAFDSFAGIATASFSTHLMISGTVSTLLSSDIGSSYTKYNRVITDVIAWAARSGSGGVTRINVLRQEDGPGGAFVSIFANNANKPAVSASLGNNVPTSGTQITSTISGSLWKAGTVLKATFDTAADVQQDVNVVIFWRPSGSYAS